MQRKLIKVENAAQAAIVLTALQSIGKQHGRWCSYYNDDVRIWGKSLVDNGYTWISSNDTGIGGFCRIPEGAKEYQMEQLTDFMLGFIGDFASIRIPDGATAKSKVKSINVSSGTVRIEGNAIQLPSTTVNVDDIEDILFHLSN